MSDKTLRQLAKDYATGVINKEIYRKSRGDLIKGIIDGNIAVIPINFPPPLSVPDNEEDITEQAKRNSIKTEIKPELQTKSNPPRPAAKVQQTVSPDNNKKMPWLFISLSSVIVIILIIAVIMFYPEPPVANQTSTTTTTDDKTSKPDLNTENITPAAGETIIADFLTAKKWDKNSIDNLINSWSNLTMEEQESAAGTNRMRRMNDSIYKQFLEAKALASIDSDKAIVKQEKLIELARSLGIEDSRLVTE